MQDRSRRLLLELFRAAIAAVDGRRCVRDALSAKHPDEGPWQVIAIGKAAEAMAFGAVDALGGRIVRLLVITKRGHLSGALSRLSMPCEALESAHPVPDESSLCAGTRLLEAVRGSGADEHLLFLISGGASSLVEVLPPAVTLDDLAELNRWAQGAGVDIAALNGLRKRLSGIKGGRLALELGDRPALALMISDVPGDDPTVIGSGLLHASVEPSPDLPMPHFARRLLARLPQPPRAEELPSIAVTVVANAAQAATGVVHAAKVRDLPVSMIAHRLQGEAAAAGAGIAQALLDAADGVWVWAGETTVHLPERPGRGGRNQHLALAAAIALEGHAGVTLLAAGTDGTDGPTGDAGAIVDGETVTRGRIDGLDPAECLTGADAGRFLEAAGDLLNTGPTGTNVGDLVIGLVHHRTIDG